MNFSAIFIGSLGIKIIIALDKIKNESVTLFCPEIVKIKDLLGKNNKMLGKKY